MPMVIASLGFRDFFGGGAVYPGSYCCKNNNILINKN